MSAVRFKKVKFSDIEYQLVCQYPEHFHAEKQNRILKMENKMFRKKIEALNTEIEQLRVEQQKSIQATINIKSQRRELVECKNELLVMGKKLMTQETHLSRSQKQNEALKVELESTKKEVHSLKQSAVDWRAKQKNLKEQLDQVIIERENLNEKLQSCETECSKLSEKITHQQSTLNDKYYQRKELIKEIHLLKQEIQKLEKEKALSKISAEDQRQELQRCELELRKQKQKLEFCNFTQDFGKEIGKKILLVHQRSHLAPSRPPSQQAILQKNQTFQKDLLTHTEELRKTKKLYEEQKQSLAQVSEQFSQSKKMVMDQKQKLKALTAERNMYKSQSEKLGKELANMKERHHIEEQQKNPTTKTGNSKQPSADKLRRIYLPPVSSKVQLKKSSIVPQTSKLAFTGKKIVISD